MKAVAAHRRWLVLLALLSVALSSHPVAADVLLQPGDRVVFLGDSITQFQNYTKPVQEYVYGRYPGLKVRFFNAGWAGDITVEL